MSLWTRASIASSLLALSLLAAGCGERTSRSIRRRRKIESRRRSTASTDPLLLEHARRLCDPARDQIRERDDRRQLRERAGIDVVAGRPEDREQDLDQKPERPLRVPRHGQTRARRPVDQRLLGLLRAGAVLPVGRRWDALGL